MAFEMEGWIIKNIILFMIRRAMVWLHASGTEFGRRADLIGSLIVPSRLN